MLQGKVSLEDVLRFTTSKCLTFPRKQLEAMVEEARAQGNADGLLSLQDLRQACSFRRERVAVRPLTSVTRVRWKLGCESCDVLSLC